MLAMCIMWLLCFILTVVDVFPADKTADGYFARTDVRTDAIVHSPWFRLPYPGKDALLLLVDKQYCYHTLFELWTSRILFYTGQWGAPTVSLAAVCAILSGIIATTIESVGDYHACAKLCDAPPPPLHAVNRGKCLSNNTLMRRDCAPIGLVTVDWIMQ